MLFEVTILDLDFVITVVRAVVVPLAARALNEVFLGAGCHALDLDKAVELHCECQLAACQAVDSEQLGSEDLISVFLTVAGKLVKLLVVVPHNLQLV